MPLSIAPWYAAILAILYIGLSARVIVVAASTAST
jgi:hypothetical protein